MVGLFAAGLATLTLLYAPQPLLPAFSREYGLHPANATLAVSVATAGLLLGVIPVTLLSRNHERRTVIVLSLFAATALGALTVVAPNWSVLLVLRGLQGMALAGVPATATAYAAEVHGVGRAGLMSGLFVAGSTMGGLSGRLVAGVLADLGGWRAGLGGGALLAATATLATGALLPRIARSCPQRRYVRPAHFAARARSTSARALSALWREADSLQLRLCLIAALLMTAFSGTYNVLAFRLIDDPYRLSQGTLGLVFLVYLAGTVASTVSGRLADRTPRKFLLVTAATLLAAGATLTLARPLALVVSGLALLTGGFFAAHGVASGWTGVAARGHRGTAAARYTFWYYAGTTLGGPVGGTAFGHGQWTGTATVVIVLALLAAAVGLTLPRSAVPEAAPARVRRDRFHGWLLLGPLRGLRTGTAHARTAISRAGAGAVRAGRGTVRTGARVARVSSPRARPTTGSPGNGIGGPRTGRRAGPRRPILRLRGAPGETPNRPNAPVVPRCRPRRRDGISRPHRSHPAANGDPRAYIPQESAHASHDQP